MSLHIVNALPIVRAIDLGYGFTKFTRDAGMVERIPSVVAPAAAFDLSAGFLARANTVGVTVDGRPYEVGRDAPSLVATNATRQADGGYARSETYRILIHAALQMMEISRIDMLVMGLPIATFASAREHLQRAYATEFTLDARKTVVREVLAVPQPLGGLVWYGVQQNRYLRLREETNLVVDPGYQTLDWLVTKGMAPLNQRSGSHAAGVSSLIRSVMGPLIAQHGPDVDTPAIRERVDRHLLDGAPVQIHGLAVDMKPYASCWQAEIENGINALLASVGSLSDIDNVVLVGGGARHYQSALQRRLPQRAIFALDEGAFANVRGFQWIGEQILSAAASRATVA